jgi:hypothetical protein
MNIQEDINRIKQVMGLITEKREGWYKYLKNKLPNIPEYILKDWIYKKVYKNIEYESINDWIDEWIVDIEWEHQKDFPISMGIFSDETQKELKERIDGLIRANVPKDEERHQTQKELLKSRGISKEPIILFKTKDGRYDLGEGWHRTVQAFTIFPGGFIQPNVYIGLNAKWVD